MLKNILKNVDVRLNEMEYVEARHGVKHIMEYAMTAISYCADGESDDAAELEKAVVYAIFECAASAKITEETFRSIINIVDELRVDAVKNESLVMALSTSPLWGVKRPLIVNGLNMLR